MKKLNGDLLTDEERITPMGLGYQVAADRLGLIYLADVAVIWKILTDWCDKVRFRHYDLKVSKISQGQFWQDVDQLADELATIMRGESPAYMAIPWFTEPSQLRQHLLEDFEKSYADMPDVPNRAQWGKDPVREYCFSFLSCVADFEAANLDEQERLKEQYLNLRLTTSGLLGMSEELVYEQLGVLFNKS